MNNAAIIGCTGFVGKFLNEKIPHSDNYNSSNIDEIKNKKYENIYFAGLPAQKWLINQNPIADLDNIHKIINCLNTVECNTFYLFSTIDVYDKNNPEEITKEPYGKNRHYFEQYICGKYKNYRIIRLPALFGIGLKKNIIYDIINNNQTEKINTNIDYQWYNMHDLWNDIHIHAKRNGIFDFFSAPIGTKFLVENCFGKDKLKQLEKNQFNLTTKSYEMQTFGYTEGTKNIINKIKKFIKVDKSTAENNISISCLSWKKEDENKIPFILNRYGIKKIEIAPKRYFNWNDSETTIIENVKHLKQSGIDFYSMQSLFNGIDVNLFDQKDKFIDHFKRIINIASLLGTKRLVYGSPSTRRIKDGENNHNKFIDTFGEISDLLKSTDIIACIEPNAKKYNCNYLYNFDQVLNVVKEINRPNIKINFDSGNASMEDDDESKIIVNSSFISHAHVSKPNLAKIDVIDYLRTFRHIIDQVTINIEMKEIEFESISSVIYEILSEIYAV